jgi:hypothetical protein
MTRFLVDFFGPIPDRLAIGVEDFGTSPSSNSLSAAMAWSMARFCASSLATMVVALVELDDSTHNACADRKRDALTRAAGYHTFRFASKQKPSVAEIAALFETMR